MRKLFGRAVGVGLVAAALVPASARTPREAPRVKASRCEALREFDLKRLRKEDAKAAPKRDAAFDRLLGDVTVPAAAVRRPPADPRVLIRVKLPPGGGYSNSIKSVVWQEEDGSWWYWRRNEGGSPPPLPVMHPDGTVTYPEIDPPVQGALSPARAAALEKALADPCRALEPAWWPWDPPLREGGRRPCPPDGSSYWAEIAVRGEGTKRVGASCINPSATFRIIETAAYASGQ